MEVYLGTQGASPWRLSGCGFTLGGSLKSYQREVTPRVSCKQAPFFFQRDSHPRTEVKPHAPAHPPCRRTESCWFNWPGFQQLGAPAKEHSAEPGLTLAAHKGHRQSSCCQELLGFHAEALLQQWHLHENNRNLQWQVNYRAEKATRERINFWDRSWYLYTHQGRPEYHRHKMGQAHSANFRPRAPSEQVHQLVPDTRSPR